MVSTTHSKRWPQNGDSLVSLYVTLIYAKFQVCQKDIHNLLEHIITNTELRKQRTVITSISIKTIV